MIDSHCFHGSLTHPSLAADAPQGWRTPHVLVLLILGIIIMIAFVVWESKYPYAMIDMKIWRDRDFSLVSRTVPLHLYGLI